ncbi:LysR family transcriptional regulator [Massilia sp. W12]|uniref:LysR family transcriptional regulator n=1 Tax=Massilia sp. W12 TaxID=3126507 RepID=UPI0030CC743A
MQANDLLLFARVVEAGSFSAAAQRVGLPKSTLSRRITQLEGAVGERLLQRTTRHLTLTETGHAVLEHARVVLEQTEAVAALAQHRQAEPSGKLRISMPGDFANLVMAPMLADFVQRYPHIVLELDLSPRRVDLIAENFDLALRMGELRDEASLAARRLATLEPGLYAAPEWIARHGPILHPSQLPQYDMLCIPIRSDETPLLRLQKGAEVWESAIKPKVLANSPEILMRLAIAGLGIAFGSDFMAAQLRGQPLQRILPEWSMPKVDVWAVFPGRRLMSAKTRVFLDWIAQRFNM